MHGEAYSWVSLRLDPKYTIRLAYEVSENKRSERIVNSERIGWEENDGTKTRNGDLEG